MREPKNIITAQSHWSHTDYKEDNIFSRELINQRSVNLRGLLLANFDLKRTMWKRWKQYSNKELNSTVDQNPPTPQLEWRKINYCRWNIESRQWQCRKARHQFTIVDHNWLAMVGTWTKTVINKLRPATIIRIGYGRGSLLTAVLHQCNCDSKLQFMQ